MPPTLTIIPIINNQILPELSGDHHEEEAKPNPIATSLKRRPIKKTCIAASLSFYYKLWWPGPESNW